MMLFTTLLNHMVWMISKLCGCMSFYYFAFGSVIGGQI